jgi:hypothetical protein
MRNELEAAAMEKTLKNLQQRWAGKQKGGIGYILLWLMGVPLPLILLIALIR